MRKLVKISKSVSMFETIEGTPPRCTGYFIQHVDGRYYETEEQEKANEFFVKLITDKKIEDEPGYNASTDRP